MSLEPFVQFHFLRPWWLLMILPTLIFVRFFFGSRQVRSRWRGVIAPHLLDHLMILKGRKRQVKPTHMLVAGSILASVAMAGPTWKRDVSPFAEDRAPLAVVLDLSGSMNQTDIKPSRLIRAKQKIYDLLAVRGGSKTGIIVYAGTSHTLIPLTDDSQVISNLLFAVDTDIMPKPGKAVEKSIGRIRTLFADSGVPGTILLITDGATEEGAAALARYCETSGHQMIVYGMGSRHQDVQDGGDDVLGGAFIPLAEKSLKRLARNCSGIYVTPTTDKSDIARIRRRIDVNFIAAKDKTRPWIDAGYVLLFPVAAVFLLWFRKGWTLTWAIAVFFGAVAAGPVPAGAADNLLMNLFLTPDQQGRYYFEQGDYERAAQCFENTLWKGVAFYRNENFDAAIEMFLQIKTPQGYFNLGNAYAHGRQYGRAIDAYRHVLVINPGHRNAQKNIAIINGVIDELNAAAVREIEPGESVGQLADDMADGPGEFITGSRDKTAGQYSAEQILNNPEVNEIWMKQVQQDPARFLRMKFQMQENSREKENNGLHGN